MKTGTRRALARKPAALALALTSLAATAALTAGGPAHASASQPTAEMRKAAQMAIAGAWKDDPDLEWILEDAMRRRGRQPGPDGTYAGYRPAEEGDG